MSNTYFNNDNNKTNSHTILPAITPNDVSEFFDNYKTIIVQHITFTDNSKDYISISLQADLFSHKCSRLKSPKRI